jgi:hypothetical protein
MRKVEILEEPHGQRRWTAVDAKTRQVILRLHDENLMRDVCGRLGWQIVEAQRQRRAG